MISITPSVADAAAPLVVPIDGKPFAAELSDIGDGRMLSFAFDGKTKQLPWAELVRWGTPLEPRRGPLVVLADGGLLAADILSADKDRLEIDSELFGRMKLPLESIAGVIFRLPDSTDQRDRLLDRLVTAEGDADRLLLDNGDELSGVLDSLDEKQAKLQNEAVSTKVEIARLRAIVFNPQLKTKPEEQPTRLWLGFNDGSRLLCKDIAPDRDGETSADLKESPKGVAASATRREPRSSERKIEFALLDQPCKTSLENLVFFQPLSGRAEYLSQIKPAEYRHVPYLGVAWPYALDRNVQGGGLRVGGQFHLKGIGLHSAARLSYDLPPGVKRFQAEAALDDSGVEGSVRFRVFVDGKEKYSSPTLRGGMPPLPIDVDVAGAKRLELVVDFADRADVQDRADWLDARLIR